MLAEANSTSWGTGSESRCWFSPLGQPLSFHRSLWNLDPHLSLLYLRLSLWIHEIGCVCHPWRDLISQLGKPQHAQFMSLQSDAVTEMSGQQVAKWCYQNHIDNHALLLIILHLVPVLEFTRGFHIHYLIQSPQRPRKSDLVQARLTPCTWV